MFKCNLIKYLFLSAYLSLGTVISTSGAAEAVPSDLIATIQVYRKAESLLFEVRKTVKNPMLEKETTFKGIIKLLKGKFYWETTEPEKSLLIYDGKLLWSVQYPPQEFKDAPLQVAKMNLKAQKKSPLILSDLFGTRPFGQIFKVEAKSKNGNIVEYNLKEKKSDTGLKNLVIKVDNKAQRIVSLSYLDEVDNETRIDFRSTQFDIKIRQGLFSYKPPQNAKVTEY